MPPSLSVSAVERSPVALDKSTVVVAIVASLLMVETFSGALRFFLDVAGVPWLLYLPKAACLAMVMLELLSFRGAPVFWLTLLGVLTSSQLALLHGASVKNLGFSLFAYSPLLLGLFCGRYLDEKPTQLGWIVALCLLGSLLGVALDLLTSLPWKGYSYELGEVELSGNKSWAFGDTDRIAGFARMSTTLAVMIAVYSLYLAAFTRLRMVRLAFYAAALTGIYLSTNKSSLAAYAFTLLSLLVVGYRTLCASIASMAGLIGVGLPVASLLLSFDANQASGHSDHMLASFIDRLVNSWPNFIGVMVGEGWSLWGAGLGVIGSTGAAFPIDGLELLSIADSTALYLWGLFGLFGVLLYLMLIPLLVCLQRPGSRMRLALFSIVLCLSLVSWATDVFEVPVAGLFIGIGISHAMSLARRPRV